MSKVKHKECFGTMFPDTLHLHTNQECKGKVFSSRLESATGWVRSGERIDADIEEWDDCQQCPEFTSCFQLCLAKVALESAVASE
jgi:hypothetical protein